MKASLLLLLPLLGSVHSDPLRSSYSVLPYGQEPSYSPEETARADTLTKEEAAYFDPDSQFVFANDVTDKRRGFNIRRIITAPFKAMRSAGNYVIGMFDDVTDRFRRVGESFGQQDEPEFSRQFYNSHQIPGDQFTGHFDYDSDYGQVFNRDVSNSIERRFQGATSRKGEQVGTYLGPVGRSLQYPPVPRAVEVEQRSARSFPLSQRTDRSYSVPAFPPADRPIPVPVPFSVYPSKLIFPSLHDVGQSQGYH